MPQHRTATLHRWMTPIFLLASVAMSSAAVVTYVRFPALDDGESYHKVFSARPPIAYHIVRPGEDVAALILLAHGAICITALVRIRRSGPTVWPILLAVHGWFWWSELCRDWRSVDGLTGDPIWQAVRLSGIAIGAVITVWAARRVARAPQQHKALLVDLLHRRSSIYYCAALAASLAAAGARYHPFTDPPDYAAVWIKALAAVWFLIAVLDRALDERRARSAPTGTPRRFARLRARLLSSAAGALLYTVAQTVLWIQYPLPALHAVVPGKLYRAGLPGAWGLWLAQQRYGFNTIVGMRTEGLPEYERRFAQGYHIRLINPQLDPTFTPHDFVALLSDPHTGPVLVHCNRGVNRTGSWVTAYRHLAHGWPLERGLEEAEQLSGKPVRQSTVDWLREVFPEHFASRPRQAPQR